MGGKQQKTVGLGARFAPVAAAPSAENLSQSQEVVKEVRMEEVAYWVTTKRAPCLMTYDQKVLGKKVTVCVDNNVEGAAYHMESPTLQKNNKRKLAIIDDESVATVKSPNVYFEVPGDQNQPVKCKEKSISDSDVDFNIKDSPVQTKSKQLKFQNISRGRSQKNKIVTSTPKGTINLRRSPRKTVNNNISLWETNFSRFGCTNGVNLDYVLNEKSSHAMNKSKRNLKFDSGDQFKNNSTVKEKHVVKPLRLDHDKYDDESDVSGLTANYIRSTKVHASSRQRKLPRGKKKTLINTGQKNIVGNADSLVICYDKAVNTNGLEDNNHNSTDSSQNIIKLVSKSNREGPLKVSRDTSLLKFMEPKMNKIESEAKCKHLVNQSNKTEVNISAQSKSSRNSRYPQRRVNPSERVKRFRSSKRVQSSCKNEVSRREEVRLQDNLVLTGVTTRSGRALRSHREASGRLNVGEDLHEHSISKSKKTISTSRNVNQIKKVVNSRRSKKRESVREKSGFSACFSNSDVESDSDAKQKKFFC